LDKGLNQAIFSKCVDDH